MPTSFRLPDAGSAGLFTEKRILIAALLALAVATAVHWSAPAGDAMTRDEECEALDEIASARVALLVADRSERVQAELGDALFLLRRARTYCRNGWLAMAQRDYAALTDGRYGRRP
jgi:hypothetical protein